MAAKLSDAQLRAVEQQLSSNPQLLQALQAEQQKAHGGRMAYLDPSFAQSRATVLQRYGIDFPDAGDYQIQIDPSGQVHLDRQNWFKRNADWILPVATIGTGGAANVLAGGAPVVTPAATTGGTTVGSAGPLTAGEVFSSGPVAGTGMAGVDVAGMGSNVATGGGFAAGLKSALSYIIPGAAAVAGSAITAHGNTKAAEIQAKSDAEALAQAKAIYEQQRKDQGPYRQTGYGSLNALNFGLGLPNVEIPQDTPLPSTIVAPGAKDAKGNPMPGAGQNQVVPPSPTMAQQMPRTGGTVPMRNPQTGLVHLIPANQVSAAQQAGGVRV